MTSFTLRLKCLCTQYKSAAIPNVVESSSQPCRNYALVIIILTFCCLLSGFLILKCKKKKKAVPKLHVTSAKPTLYPVSWSCENHARLKCIKSILSDSQRVLNICTRKLLTYTNCITLNLLPTSAYDMRWMQIFSNLSSAEKKMLNMATSLFLQPIQYKSINAIINFPSSSAGQCCKQVIPACRAFFFYLFFLTCNI